MNQALDDVGEIAAAPPPGLSAHARALWRRAARFRRLADELAAADAGGARP